VLNPPWTLQTSLAETLPWLARTLAADDQASWELQVSEPERAKQDD
jgi:23S rRNA (adenine2030-N6)-methyltransferase